MDNIKVYSDYVNNNVELIAEEVNRQFEISKDWIKAKIIRKIREYLTPIPAHYEWEEDDCPYDHSGRIVKNGFVSLNQTIDEFLENEYSGNTEATYISGMGLQYNTFGNELSYYTIEIAGEIMYSSIGRHIEKHFNISLSDDELEAVRDKCGDFDRIYDICLATDFFCYEAAIEFTKIGNRKLYQVVKKRNKVNEMN
ncbi:MAG: hypothetical protein ACI4F9_11050 [Lachnospiraceae bacterium]